MRKSNPPPHEHSEKHLLHELLQKVNKIMVDLTALETAVKANSDAIDAAIQAIQTGDGGVNVAELKFLTDKLSADTTRLVNLVPPNTGVPFANAGPNQAVSSGQTVTLDASGSTGQDPVTFAWSQDSGPQATLSNKAASQPTFVAPAVSSKAGMVFSMVANSSAGSSKPSTVTITVSP